MAMALARQDSVAAQPLLAELAQVRQARQAP
jgi:hypothetical protein